MPFSRLARGLFVAALAFVGVALLQAGSPVQAVSTNVVISQVYGGGGNSGAPYTHDYIELFNRGSSPVNLAGWSLQYTSATGTGTFGASAAQITELSGTIQPGQYVLVQEATQAAVGVALPTPDVTDASPIAMAAGAGKVALANVTASLGCNGGSTPCTPTQLANIVDLVGYGNANFFEGSSAAPTLTNTTAGFRAGSGCTDTDQNGADFTSGAPSPRNSASSAHSCTVTEAAPSVSSTTPADNATSVPVAANVTVTFSEPVSVSGAWFSISCATSGTHAAAVTDTNPTFTLDPDSDFAGSELCTATIVGAQVADDDISDPPDTMTTDFVFDFTTVSLAVTHIHEIQGAAHTSPLAGTAVTNVPGVVTGVASNGFYLQDPTGDSNTATSEGIFVFTSSAPTVQTGYAVTVAGTVQEFRPGGASGTNLTSTEIVSPTVFISSTGNPLPAPTVIGAGGRVPPPTVIDDDATGSVETSGTFDPATDGIDFYESLEGMRVQVNNAVAVGPTNTFGETPVLVDNGAGAGVRTNRGGIVISASDFNPERIILDDPLASIPAVNVGDHFNSPVVGLLDYSFGNFKLLVTSPLTRIDEGLAREVTAAPTATQIAVATLNVENLDPGDGAPKFNALANIVVNHLKSPDILALEEIQDNTGPTNDGVVDASTTFGSLISAITTAGGPSYSFRSIDPVNNQDGGEPGGNIRVGFLFRADRGVSFVDRPGGGPTTPTTVVNAAGTPQLSASPGRIDPTNAAFNTSRKPLAGEFAYNGRTLFVIANHFNSKGGDDPLFGRFQPPSFPSELQRHQQAQIVNDFVDSLLAVDSGAYVIVLGDLNDFDFAQTLTTLKGGVLTTLADNLPLAERYSYVFDGNSQMLDHILVSTGLFNAASPIYDIVHVNSEYGDQVSDHEPQVVRLTVPPPPDTTPPVVTCAASPTELWPPNGKLKNITVTVNASDNSGTVQFALESVASSEPGIARDAADWSIGTADTQGQLRAQRLGSGDGRAYTLTYRATDPSGNSATCTAVVTVPHDRGGGQSGLIALLRVLFDLIF